jgi:hypothetical protein
MLIYTSTGSKLDREGPSLELEFDKFSVPVYYNELCKPRRLPIEDKMCPEPSADEVRFN